MEKERGMHNSRVIACVLGVLFYSGVAVGQLNTGPRPGSDAPVLNYKAVPEWPQEANGDKGFPSGPWNYWQVPSVTVEKNGNILVLHRGDFPILEYDPNGKFIGPWSDLKFSEGKILSLPPEGRTPQMSRYQAIYGPSGCSNCGAHAIRTDPEGNIWAVDAAGDVVYKLNPQGHVIMTLGQKGKAGLGPDLFYFPTDVAFASNGDIYLTDGYGNPRVVKYSHSGKFILQFGTRGNGPGQFQLPHNVVVDAQGKVYVTDRDNQRVEIFDSNGKYLTEWDHTGGVSSLVMTIDERIWLGGTLRDLNGKILGRLPGESSVGAHGAAAAANGDVYLGLLSGKVEKFIKQ
jgi:DNA-binding beta-propeller fold protein YncE